MKKSFTEKGYIFDIVNRDFFYGEVYVENGKIKDIKKFDEVDDDDPCYILPGYVDSHVHIESSMLIPSRFAKLAVKHGVVAVVTDPHEIANVLGEEGINFMIEDSKKVPLKFYFGAPSCVPATDFETSGAKLDAEKVKDLLKRKDIYFLSEMMNYPGVIYEDKEVMKKIKYAKELGKKIDGHAPGLRGEDLKKYVSAGISTDHEAYTEEEAKEKIALGMKIQIREGSAAKNFEALHSLIEEYPDKLMFCTDDSHPDDLEVAYIDKIVLRASNKGYDIIDILKIATLNPVKHYNLDVGLLQIGDPADFIVISSLFEMKVIKTYINGDLVYDGENVNFDLPDIAEPINNFNVEKISIDDLKISKQGDKIKVIQALEGELITKKLVVKSDLLYDKDNDNLVSSVDEDILKIAVLNRYEKNAKPVVGFIKGFGLKKGAIATSVAHDSHNIIAIGVDDKVLLEVINRLIDLKGGLVVSDGNEIKELPLEVAGLMSATNNPSDVAKKYRELNEFAKNELGSTLKAPFMTLSFMALLVIPELKIGDKGLFDVSKFSFTSLFE